MRIGIPRAFFYERITPPSRTGERPAPNTPTPNAERGSSTTGGPTTTPSGAPFGTGPGGAAGGGAGGGGFNRGGGLDPEELRIMTDAIDILKQQGAVIVDPADIPSITTQDPDKNFLLWGQCSGWNSMKGRDANCSVVLKYGMKRDFNKFLATLGPAAPVKSLTELREWNITHINGNAIRFGESNLDISDEMDVEADRARYQADRAKDIELAAAHGIDEAMKANNLDVLMFPGASGASIAAKPGYPTVIVPFGMAPNTGRPPFPPGVDPKPSPFGVAFTGMACSEPKLLQAAYAFEQATKRRVPPASTP
jgi:amidase